jgi:replication-associated recombination protein RarA
MNPQDFIPRNAKELIGTASRFCGSLLEHVATLKDKKDGKLKLVFRGEPGCGKTSLVDILAESLAIDKFDIERINGKNVTIDVIRDWQKNACYASMSGGWKIKLINEMDLIPQAAQELMLSYLDELPARTAIIGTSNADCGTLTERFETRFQIIKIEKPTISEVAKCLVHKWELPRKAANHIATVSDGNVRQAFLDAGTFLMCGALPEKREKVQEVVCSARSEAAKKAWETMRANGKA